MTILWAIDPGKVTGITVGIYTDRHPYAFWHGFAVPDGADGVREWWKSGTTNRPMPGDVLVVEKFTLRAGNPFTADTTPKEVEGVIKTLWDGEIHWQNPADKQSFYDDLLKKHGLWLTGKDVNWEDGRDANDATSHALEFLRQKQHAPTLKAYFRED